MNKYYYRGDILNIAVVEDMKNDFDIISNFIDKYYKKKQISYNLHGFKCEKEFCDEFEKDKFDIIFLDIYIDNLNGMELARNIRKKDEKCLIIFSTVSKEFAIESYEVRAFYYLLKPYSYEQFMEVMNLAHKVLPNQVKYIEVKEARINIKVCLDDIIYIDYYNHYIQIHTNYRMIKSYMKFKEIMELLEPYKQFLYCYRNCMINMSKVSGIREKDFVMKNGEIIPISKKHCGEIKQYFADYIFDKMRGAL